MSLSVAIIICTHNRAVLLERCLRSVSKLKTKPDRVLVVDNAPNTNEVPAIAARYGAGYLLVPQRGLSRARNRGARACHEDILAYADDDMVLHPDWLSSLLSEFSDASVAGVTGPFLPLEMENEPASNLTDTLCRMAWGAESLKLDCNCSNWFERANFGGLGDGNFAVRRSVLDEWTGFDERLGRGMPLNAGEDHYAFFELILRGYAFVYSPRAIVFHPLHQYTHHQILDIQAQSIAYAGFLSLQHPKYAWRVLKYLIESIFSKRRKWRKWIDTAPGPRRRRIPTLSTIFTAIRILRNCYARESGDGMPQESPSSGLRHMDVALGPFPGQEPGAGFLRARDWPDPPDDHRS